MYLDNTWLTYILLIAIFIFFLQIFAAGVFIYLYTKDLKALRVMSLRVDACRESLAQEREKFLAEVESMWGPDHATEVVVRMNRIFQDEL